MSRQFDSELFRTARQTFENLAFMLSLDEDGPGASSPQERRQVQVEFAGPFSGRLVVSVSARLLPEIAMNMLGLEAAELTLAQQEDAFKELANVVCGNLLPVIAGTEAVFTVGAPALMGEVHPLGSSAPEPAGTASLTLENGTAELALFIVKAGSDSNSPVLAGEAREGHR